ncbi:FemAB family XrtA/PEP-CTERM system-associated protein [Steroidobacter flavus]|uniref:FemAB family XrtA/PEP-CTERM system-associated protein n=1 Tax=Steroidobacter flavus TaxID=1842136 RepID=A0ABV8T2D3_9GAMM
MTVAVVPQAALASGSAPLTVETATATHATEWNAFLRQQPPGSFYHLFEWSGINQQALRNPGFNLIARAGGEIRGVLPLTFVASPLFGRVLCSMPFVNYGGPVSIDAAATEALVRAARDKANELKADYLELRCASAIETDMAVSTRKISMHIELAPDPDTLWNKFASKHRTNIRRAQKNNLEVRSGGMELLDVFYSVMEQSWRSLGTPFYARSYFETILKALPEYTSIFVCSQGTTPVAVAFNGYFNGMVEGLWAGGTELSRPLQANYVLYWEMMRDACVRGCTRYHLGRSTADSGAEDFKKKWNATSSQLYWYFHRPRGGEMPQLNVDNPKYKLAIQMWQKLPLWATRLIGPPLARSIP